MILPVVHFPTKVATVIVVWNNKILVCIRNKDELKGLHCSQNS